MGGMDKNYNQGGRCPLELEQTMTEKTEILEFADKTVDRAIKEACRHFDVDKDQLNIKLITRGSTGLFGLGGRKAKITASLKDGAADEKDADSRETEKKPVEPEHAQPEESVDMEVLPRDETALSDVPGTADSPNVQGEVDEQESSGGDEKPPAASGHGKDEDVTPLKERVVPAGDEPAALSEEALERLERARMFTSQLLDKAGLDGIVQVSTDPANPGLDISGDDISLIIGKDGHTLDAIEYIVNLTVKRAEERGGKRIHIDVQGYRAKRDESLRRAAEKLAVKARKTRRSVAMAPMNSRERRIVHMTLKGMGGVRTHSTGDGRLRKVIITPLKKNDSHHRQGKRHGRR